MTATRPKCELHKKPIQSLRTIPPPQAGDSERWISLIDNMAATGGMKNLRGGGRNNVAVHLVGS